MSDRTVSSRPARPSMPVIVAAGTALAGFLLWPGFAKAQDRDCKLVGVGGYTESRRQDSVNYRHHATGGIDYRCADGTRLRADSAVIWERSGNAFFMGSVHFEDPDTELTADSARYFENTEELIAYGRVVLTDRKGGAVIRGRSLNYLSGPRSGEEDRILVHGGRPRATVYPARRPAAPAATVDEEGGGEDGVPEDEEAEPAADSVAGPAGEGADTVAEAPAGGADTLGAPVRDPPADPAAGNEPPSAGGAEVPELARLDSLLEGKEATPPDTGAEGDAPPADAAADSVTPAPYEVAAPRIMIDGRRFFRAGGGVTVTRDSLRATGDSLDYDQEEGAMLFLGGASVEDSGFRLTGRTVSLTPAAGLDEEILAREEAELTGEEVVMTAPAIRLFLEDGMVGRLVALPTIPPLPDRGAEYLDTTWLTPGDAARVRAMAEAAAAADSPTAPDSLPRPSVVAADFNLTGDSIEVLSPGQVLDIVTAVGTARADAMDQDAPPGADLPELAANDWMEGETIIAKFARDGLDADTASPVGASAGNGIRLESLTAVDDARSLYRLHAADTTAADTSEAGARPDTAADGAPRAEPPAEPPPPGGDSAATGQDPAPLGDDSVAAGEDPMPAGAEDGETGEECDTTWADDERPPELHYVSGNRITIFLEGRKVVRMEVTGRTQGYHFEPVPPDCETAAGDTAAAPPDTAETTTAPDTAAAPPPVTVPRGHPHAPPRHRAGSGAPGHALPGSGTRPGPRALRRTGGPE